MIFLLNEESRFGAYFRGKHTISEIFLSKEYNFFDKIYRNYYYYS